MLFIYSLTVLYIIKEIFKTLDAEGYIVTAYPNGQIDINWNEKLVEQKVKTDSFVLSHEERKLKNITRKVKQVDARYNFLANPQKMASEKELSIDDQLNIQVQKILREKESLQNKFKKLLK